MHGALDFFSYRRPFVSPLRTSQGTWAVREGFLVHYQFNGQTHWGDVAPLPTFGSESLVQAAEFLTQAAVDGVDARALQGLPCCAFALGGAGLKPGVFVNYPVAGLLPSGAGAWEALEKKMAQGYRCFKWKIGVDAVSVEIERLLSMLAGSPAAIRFRLDANAALSPADLGIWLTALTEHRHRIEFLEQPLAVGLEEQMADAMRAYGVPIALDESLTFSNYSSSRHDWLGPLVIKPALMGNVRDLARRLAPVASRVVLSSAFESKVAIETILFLAEALPQLQYALGFDTATAFDDSLTFHLQQARLMRQPRVDFAFERMRAESADGRFH